LLNSRIRSPDANISSRSQVQIASRTFHFVLPPPPPPEDTPSPSSQSSINLPRSPSLDITSISPPSSQPSHTPPPSEAKVLALPPGPPTIEPPRKPTPLLATTEPQLPNSNSIGKSSKTGNSKKRKKVDDDTTHPRPKPEDMPPKPPFTYAQLIYRAIKSIGDKATLQEICSWIMNTYEYYRYAEAGWTVTPTFSLP
jgi:forkhead box protein K